MRGKLVTFEGGEGSGKSTQIKTFAETLIAAGLDVVVTREPGGTPLAEKLRSLVLSGICKAAGPEVEALFFAAARADHYHRLIKPSLDAGKWVVCDRFYDSTSVYQSISGASPEAILELRSDALGDFSPDLTIILDIETEVAAGRAAARRASDEPDRFEKEGLEFHREVRSRFLAIAEAEPHRCEVVDAGGTIEEVASRIFHQSVGRGLFDVTNRKVRRRRLSGPLAE